MVVLTLTPHPGPGAERWTNAALFQVADELQAELIKVDEVGFNYLVGGQPDQIRVEPDPERLALYGNHLEPAGREGRKRQPLVYRRQP